MAKTINGTSAADTITVTESDVTVNAGSGDDTVTIISGSHNVIHGNAGNDTIVLENGAGSENKLYGDAGNDIIDAQNISYKVTTYGGNGIDTVYGGSGNDVLYGQEGNDTLKGKNGNDTLYGGSGDDKLYGGAGKDVFVYSGGNDIIYDYQTGEDVIKLAENRFKSGIVRGNDIQLTLANGGLITVKNTAGKQIELVDSRGQSHFLTPVSQQSIIKKLMKSLDDTSTTVAATAVDAAIKYASGGMFTSSYSLRDRFVYDVKNYGVTETGSLSGSDGWDWVYDESSNQYNQVVMPGTDKFLKDFCGIDLGNSDTGSITGYDAGGMTVKTAESIVPESGSLANAQYPSGKSKTVNGVTIKWPGNSDLSTSERTIVAGLNTYWMESALNLVKESYGISYADSGVPSTAHSMDLKFTCFPSKTYTAQASAVYLEFNMARIGTVDTSNNNGYFSSLYYDGTGNVVYNDDGTPMKITGYIDRVLAHELTHAVMGATLNNGLVNSLFTSSFSWLMEGLAELAHGIDDERLSSICELSQHSNTERLNSSINSFNADTYTSGYMLLRYFAKQVADNSFYSKLPPGVTGNYYSNYINISSEAKGTFDVFYYGYGNRVKIISFDENSHNVGVLANELNNTIYVNGTENKVYGEDGNDIIEIKGGNKHAISGGLGNDHIIIGENVGTGVKAYGDDGDDTFKARNSYSVTFYGGAGNDELGGGTSVDQLFGGAGIDYLYGEAGNDKLYGNDGNDKLYGGDGNDMLYGQAGSDTLTGGAGKDAFVYYTGYGNETITDYMAGEDTIQLSSGYISKSVLTNSGKDVKYTIGDGSITVKDGAGKAISIKDGRGSFTASGTTITLGSDFGGTMSAAGYLNTVKNVNGQSATKALMINGNGNANDIFGGSGSDKLHGGAGSDRLFGGAGIDYLYGEAGNDKLYGNAGNDKLYGGDGNDLLYGQEGSDTLTGGAGKDTFVYYTGYGNETIADYTTGEDTVQLSSGYISKSVLANSGKDVKFTIGDGSITLKDGAGKSISIKDGRGSFTASGTSITLGKDFGGTMSAAGYLNTVKNVNGQSATKALTINGNGNANDIFGGSGSDKLHGGAGSDRLFGGAGIDYLYGEAGNDKLYGNAGNDKLYGGDGDDMLYGQEGSDTLTGGAGKDTFVYYTGYGNETIADYTAGEDTIQLASGYISKSVLTNSGKDVKFTIGDGSITVKDGAGKAISIKDGRGSFTASGTTITLGKDFGGTISAEGYLDTVTEINGRNATKALTLNGFINDITLYGGSGNDRLNGGDGADQLIGGLGNDELTGGAGKDTFVYYKGHENDTITDYTAGEDTIRLASGYVGLTELVNDTDVRFTISDGSITVKDGAGKAISIKDGRGSFTASDTAITLGKDFGGTISAEGYLDTVTEIDGRNATKALTLNGFINDITLYGGSGNDRLYGGESDDELYGGTGDDQLVGGSGNDHLYGDAGDDILFGEEGNDVFYYIYGNDTILDYEAGKDIIKLDSVTLNNIETSDSDVLLYLSNGGKVTIKNTVGQTVNYQDSYGNLHSITPAITQHNIISNFSSGMLDNSTCDSSVSVISSFCSEEYIDAVADIFNEIEISSYINCLTTDMQASLEKTSINSLGLFCSGLFTDNTRNGFI